MLRFAFSIFLVLSALGKSSWAEESVKPVAAPETSKPEATVLAAPSTPATVVRPDAPKPDATATNNSKQDPALAAIEKEMAAKYQPAESLSALPLALEKGLLIDFGITPAPKQLPVTLKNNGKQSITIKDLSLGAPFSIEKNGCVGELKGGAKCELSVQFEAKSRGNYSVPLNVTASSSYQQEKWYSLIKGFWQAPPALRLRGDAYFNEALTGKKIEKKFTLFNDGDAKAEGVEVTLANPGHFSIAKSECGSTLEGGKSCTVTLAFEAKADGSHQDSIRVSYVNGASGKTNFENAVAGVALKPAKVLLTLPEAGNLGAKVLGLKLEFDWILSNIGDVSADKIEETIQLKLPFTYRKRGFPGEGGTCKKSLGPRESCRISATFAPLFQGDASQEFGFTFFDGKEAQNLTTIFKGSGLTPARLSMKEPAPGAFQSVLMTKLTDRRFHIINEGQTDAKDVTIVPNDFGKIFKLLSLVAGDEGELCSNLKVLKPTESCEFAVSFSSEKGGDFESSVGIKYNDGLKTQITKYPFRARALSTARIAFGEKDAANFGNVLPNQAKTVQLKVTNEGEHRAEQFKIHGLGDGFTLKDKTDGDVAAVPCTTDLDDGKSCVFNIEFKNTLGVNAAGAKADRPIKLTFYDGLKDTETAYLLKAAALRTAKVELAEGGDINFGEILVTGEVEKEVKLKNSGDLPVTDLVIKLISDDEMNPFVMGSNTCADTLESGKTCAIKFKYLPVNAGDQSAKLMLTYADEHSGELKNEVALLGKAKMPAKLVFDSESVDFGNVIVGIVIEKKLLLKNEGGSQAQKLQFNFGGDANGFGWKGGKYPGEGGDCGETLESKANCALVILFKDEKGAQPKATLVASFQDGVKSQRLEVAMGGNSVVPGKLAFEKEALDFGNRAIGGKNVESVKINNSGGTEVEFLIDQMAFSGAVEFAGGAFPGAGGNCDSNLAKGGNCKLVLEPKGTDEETLDGKLTVVYKDIVTERAEISLGFKGVLKTPAVVESEGETDFGSVFLGETKTLAYMFKNNGGFDTELKLSSGSPQIKMDEGCHSLKGKDSCTVNVSFTPTSNKPADLKLSVRYSNGIDSKGMAVPFKGVGSKLARLSLGKTVLDFGTIPTAERRNKLVTLKNEGDVDATQMELSGIKDDTIGFDGSFPGKTGNCSDTLKPGAECILDITFAPVAAGSSEQNLEIKYNNGKEEAKEPLMVRGLAEGSGDVNRELASEPPK